MLTQNVALTLGLLCLGLGAGCDKKSNTPEPDAGIDPFEVLSVSPADGADDVYTDQTLQIRFSRRLDPATVDASSVRVTHDGTPADGRLLASGDTVIFVPLGLAPDAEYTLSLSDTLAADDGGSLAAPVTSTFHTVTTMSNGATEPYGHLTAPFAQDRFVYLSRRVEYVLVGGDVQGTGQNTFVIDPLDFNPVEPAPTNDLLYAVTEPAFSAGNTRLTAVGNLDSDPADEVVLLGHGPTGPATIRFMNVVDGDLGLWDMPLTLAINGNQTDRYEYDVAVGDIDGDGYDEVAVLGVVPTQGTARLWTFDDADHGHLSLGARDVMGAQLIAGCEGVFTGRVAVGNVDDDPDEEILVVVSTEYDPDDLWLSIIDDPQSPALCAEHDLNVGAHFWAGIDFDVTVANLDGQGRSEIVVASRWMDLAGGNICGNNCSVELLHRVPGGVASVHEFPANTETEDMGTCTTAHRPRMALHPFEFDPDGRSELLIEDQIWQWPAGLDAPEALPFVFPFMRMGSNQVQAVTTGDISGDGVDDVLLALSDGTLEAWSIRRVHVGYDLELEPMYELVFGRIHLREPPNPGSFAGLALAAANLDDDSVVVAPKRVSPADPADRSVVQQRVLSDDRPVLLVAAPPCHDAPMQSSAACETAIGVDTQAQPDLATNVGVTAGLSIQFPEVMANDLATPEAAKNFAAQVHAALASQGASALQQRLDVLVDTAASHRDDLVVFYTVPKHRYVYELAAHPNPAAVGAEVYVDLPLPPRILVATRSAYNATQAAPTLLDGEILSHTTGDPSSYSPLSKLPQILGGSASFGFTSPAEDVPEDTGECTYGMTLGSLDASAFEQLSMPSAVGGKRCDLGSCVGYLFGPGAPPYAQAYLSEGTTFHTTLGALDSAQSDDLQYAAGCFAYLTLLWDHDVDDRQAIVIVNHYVD